MKIPLTTIHCVHSNRTVALFEDSHVGVYNGLLHTLHLTGSLAESVDSIVPMLGPSSGDNITEIQGVYLYDGTVYHYDGSEDTIKRTEIMTLDEIIERSENGNYNVTGWVPRNLHPHAPSSDSKGLITHWKGATVILRTLSSQKDPEKHITLNIPNADIREEFLTFVFDFPNLLYQVLSVFESRDGDPTMVINSDNIHQLYQFLLMMSDPSILQRENTNV